MAHSVSVLLPVFNGERYVAQTIDSVLAQSYRDFELVILDDGSQDRTPAILQEFATRDARVRLLQHPNRGVGATLNRGLAEARGALVAQIGADDLALPGRLQKQVEFFERHPDHVLVGGYLRIIDAEGRVTGVRTYPTSDAAIRKRMLVYNPFGAPSVMYRRDAAIASGGFTPRFWTCEDYDFILRLAKLGKVANLAEPLVAYRLHGGAVKSRATLAQLRDTLDLKRVARAEYGYHESPYARAVALAQELMTHLPAAMTYWLFRKLAIRRL